MSDPIECPGAGKCHGCLKWCNECGDIVTHVCDARLRGERCDQHPVPPPSNVIRSARKAAEAMIDKGREMERDGQVALREAVAAEGARRVYDRQMAGEERKAFAVTP